MIRRGVLFLGLAEDNSLIISPSDKRPRRRSVTVYHEHIVAKLDPRWIYTDWCVFIEPTAQELADNEMAIQEQMKVLVENPTDEPIVEELEQSDHNGVLGLYLGKWFLNPDRDIQRENRVLFVLTADRPVWIPVFC